MSEFLSAELVATLILLTMGLVLLVLLRPSLTETTGGKILAFLALFLLPLASLRGGFNIHMESSKTTEFCMSCHVMEPYGQSLLLDEPGHIPAEHFQNRRVERNNACFSCHTQYTMFGDLSAKMNGLKHLVVYYSGQTPEIIELYKPYNNRECLHCHLGSRRFEELHEYDKSELVANQVSCMSCHGQSHDVDELEGAEMWKTDLADTLKAGP